MKRLLLASMLLTGCDGTDKNPAHIACYTTHGALIYQGRAKDVQTTTSGFTILTPLDAPFTGKVITTNGSCAWLVE